LFELEIEQGNQNRSERRRERRDKPLKANFKPSTQVVLERAIVAWSFEFEVTPENIGSLQPWVAAIVEDKVNDLNPFERNTPKNTGTHSKDEDQEKKESASLGEQSDSLSAESSTGPTGSSNPLPTPSS
jgi:hypothetical protein